MNFPTPKWLQDLEDFVEGAGDDIESAAFELRDSFAIESIKAGIVVALKATQKCPVVPSGILIGIPIPGTAGTIEIAIMGIRSRIKELLTYIENPPKTRKEILHFFFTFAPTYIKVVPEFEVSVFGANMTLGKGGFIIEGGDVLESLEHLILE